MDPIANMLIMLKNGSLAGKTTVSFPYSNIKNSIATCLHRMGYIGEISKKNKKGFPVLEISLVYTDKEPKIKEVARISKQSRRVYFGLNDIHPIRGGKGILVLSTPKGILSGDEAKKQQVGGEALFKIW